MIIGINRFFATAAEHAAMYDDSGVIIEFLRVGAYVKVSAIDPVTYTEVCIVGDPSASEEMLTRTAMRKLKRALLRGQGRNQGR